jgi:hypothetical protein
MAVEQLVTRDEIIAKLNRRPSDGERRLIVRVAQMAIGQTIGTVGDASGDGSRHIKLSEIVALKDI